MGASGIGVVCLFSYYDVAYYPNAVGVGDVVGLFIWDYCELRIRCL